MSRMRSPSYPSVSLRQAVELVEKIHQSNRTNVIDRQSAARDMGYSGLTGRSLKVLAALLQFGLLSKAGKGEVKVTQTAVDILHGIDPLDRDAALLQAGTSPTLFQELHDRFPEGPPSENSIRSYLIQQGFADVAIGPAITAYMDTYHYLENVSEVADRKDGAVEIAQPEAPMEEAPPPSAKAPLMGTMKTLAATAYDSGIPDLNKINMNIQGDRVLLSGLLDLKGLRLLKKRIESLEMLLEPLEDEKPLAAFDETDDEGGS